ncbi:MAG: zinc ribbon domain-containing protein [Candidatus Omnitrophica bacterium]|nr:zinc ribbon domain-containing protein [Candidatus Omnitrophota bacterium]
MPTYDYRCESCAHEFEHFQSMSSRPLSRCPECGKKLERLFGRGTGVIFKGSGFYQTDYKKPVSGEAAEKPTPSCGSGKCRQPDVCAGGTEN